jgi:Phytanoyl-CoA dioxygenase (PhyH)
MSYDRSIVTIRLQGPAKFSDVEAAQISESLRRNGIAIIENFLDGASVGKFVATAERSLETGRNAGYANFATLEPVQSQTSVEFHHPFAVSSVATGVVTNRGLLDMVEAYVGEKARIHSAIIQKTFPLGSGPAVDWHVDCGANKQLNGGIRFPERRLRLILYLSDVLDGGLGYILDSRDARDVFLAQQEGELFPPDKVPEDPDRRIEVLAPKGTLILFDTHGLHRPSPLESDRLVMNVWFCGENFPAHLAPILLQPANLPAGASDSLYVFATARDFEGRVAPPPTGRSRLRSLARRFLG